MLFQVRSLEIDCVGIHINNFNNFLGQNIKLDTNLRIDQETIKGRFSVYNPNWNFSDRALISAVESSVTDRMTDYGYESNTTAFSFGSNWEQYEDLFFSPTITVSHEELDNPPKCSVSVKSLITP